MHKFRYSHGSINGYYRSILLAMQRSVVLSESELALVNKTRRYICSEEIMLPVVGLPELLVPVPLRNIHRLQPNLLR